MVKSTFTRKIWDNGRVSQEIVGYKFYYNGISYGVYNCKDYNCQYHNGYIPVLICNNEKVNGLSLIDNNCKTIKEARKKVDELIDNKKDLILARIKEV